MRRFRRILYAALGLMVVAGASLAGARLYFSSSRAAAEVSTRLSDVYGGRVEVRDLDIGFNGSQLRGVQIYEMGSEASAVPWITADAQAGVTLWDVLVGNSTPEEFTVVGIEVTLRFDAAGKLLTRWPVRREAGARARLIHLQCGRVTLKQEGRDDMVIDQVNGDIRAEGERLVLTGTASQPWWGEWSAAGYWDRESGDAAITLKTPGANFTQDQLTTLPFVPAKTWEQVQVDGNAAVDMTVRWVEALHAVRYRIALDADKTRVHISAIDLTATETTGQVVIEDGQVRLKGLKGVTADGKIATSGELDFRQSPDALSFKVSVERVKLKRLPAQWFKDQQFVQLVDGRLTGHADLTVKINPDGPYTTGEGQGEMREVKWGLFPRPDMKLRMVWDGKRPKFSSPKDNGGSAGQ